MTKEPIIAYKAFNSDMTCRGHQFEVGKTYKLEGEAELCGHGFHACLHPLDILTYYPPAGSRFAVVEYPEISEERRGDTKICGVEITINAEIQISDLVTAAVRQVFDAAKWIKGKAATGDSGAASATGYSGAASATGDYGAASATGYRGAASATGYSGAASATGDSGAAMASGYDGKAMAASGCAIFLCERGDNWEIINVWSGIAGKDGVKPLTWYTLKDGKLVEVKS